MVKIRIYQKLFNLKLNTMNRSMKIIYIHYLPTNQFYMKMDINPNTVKIKSFFL